MQITTGSTTRTLGPVMLAILGACPAALALIEGRGKKVATDKFDVQGMQLEIRASLSEVSIDLTIARGLDISYLTDDDEFTGTVDVTYCGKNGDLADDLAEVGQRGGTLADVFAKTPRGDVPALLEPFAGLTVSYDSLSDERGGFFGGERSDYVSLKLDDTATPMAMAA